MVEILPITTGEHDIRPLLESFSVAVTASGERVSNSWAGEVLDAIIGGREYCLAVAEEDKIRGILVYSVTPPRAHAFISWSEEADRNYLLLVMQEFIRRAGMSRLTISGIHPNVSTEIMRSVAAELGFRRKCRFEMSLHISKAMEGEVKFPFTSKPLTDVQEEVLSDFEWKAYEGTPDQRIFADSPEDNRRLMHSLLQGDYGPVIRNASPALFEGERLIAFAAVTDLAEYTFVADIAVDRDYRRKGLGRSLLLNAVQASLQLGRDEMKLWVSEDNTGAFSLYSSLGFVKEREGVNYIRTSGSQV